MPITINGTGNITGLTSGAGIASTALSGQVPDANAPSGSVIQVVSATSTSGSSSTTSASFVDSGFSLSITPSNASNKIAVLFSFNLQASSGAQAQSLATIFRSSTNILNTDGNLLYNNFTGANIHSPLTLTVVDSPSTTSSVTYSLRHRALTSTTSIINASLGAVTITLMEIAA